MIWNKHKREAVDKLEQSFEEFKEQESTKAQFLQQIRNYMSDFGSDKYVERIMADYYEVVGRKI